MNRQPAVLLATELDRLVAIYGSGNFAELEAELLLLLERHPRSGFAWKLLSAALLNQGKQALHALAKAAELLPGDAEALSNLGNAYQQAGQFDAAVTHLHRALAIDPRHAVAHYNLGAALTKLGRIDDAAERYRSALSINPESPAALNNLGNLLVDIGALDEATACYRSALKVDPDYAHAHSNLLLTPNYDAEVTAAEILDEARRYGEMVTRKVPAPLTAWPDDVAPGRLRVGMVSADFHSHPVGFFSGSADRAA